MSAAAASVVLLLASCPSAPRPQRRHRSLTLEAPAACQMLQRRLDMETPQTPVAHTDSSEEESAASAAEARVARLLSRGIANAPRRGRAALTPHA